MRQRIRYEPAIGTISYGIEHEMTREREPPPSSYRHPRRFIKLTAHTTTLPVRRAEERNGETGNEGRPITDKESGTQNPASHHPTASKEQEDEGDGGTASTRQPSNITQQGEPFQNSERARARERHGKEASRQTSATPAAANRQQLTHPTPVGGGLNQAGRAKRTGERGSGERKGISRIYIGIGGRYAFIPSQS